MFNLAANEINYEQLDEFLQRRESESEVLEYKSEIKGDPILAKAVAAFANTYGGILLVGLKTDEEDKPILPPVGIPFTEGLELTVINKCLSALTPPYMVPLVVPVRLPQNPERCVLFVRVFDSRHSPHAIERNTKTYIRVGAQSHRAGAGSGGNKNFRLATIDELTILQKRRNQSHEFASELIKSASIMFKDRFHKELVFSTFFTPKYPTKPLIQYDLIEDCLERESGIGMGHNITNKLYDMISIPDGLGLFTKGTSILPYYSEYNRFGVTGIYWNPLIHSLPHRQNARRIVELDKFLQSAHEHFRFTMNFLKNAGFMGLGTICWRINNFKDTAFGIGAPESPIIYSICKVDSFDISRDMIFVGTEPEPHLLEGMVNELAWKSGAYSDQEFKKEPFLRHWKDQVQKHG